jgi:hypothetical protein
VPASIVLLALLLLSRDEDALVGQAALRRVQACAEKESSVYYLVRSEPRSIVLCVHMGPPPPAGKLRLRGMAGFDNPKVSILHRRETYGLT